MSKTIGVVDFNACFSADQARRLFERVMAEVYGASAATSADVRLADVQALLELLDPGRARQVVAFETNGAAIKVSFGPRTPSAGPPPEPRTMHPRDPRRAAMIGADNGTT